MVLLWKQVRRLKPQIFSNDSIKSQRKKKTVVYLEIIGISPKEVRENGDRLVKVG